jgi:beta-lactamase class A
METLRSRLRVDRIEPQMNDSTLPMAMTQTVTRLLTTSLLSDVSREKLIQWMVDTHTGVRRIREGLPKDWRAGDKTGTGIWRGMPNRHNDVAVLWPTGRPLDKPVVVSVFYEGVRYSEDMRPEDDAVLARVGEIVGRWVG